jgi:hypothetical protein
VKATKEGLRLKRGRSGISSSNLPGILNLPFLAWGSLPIPKGHIPLEFDYVYFQITTVEPRYKHTIGTAIFISIYGVCLRRGCLYRGSTVFPDSRGPYFLYHWKEVLNKEKGKKQVIVVRVALLLASTESK